MLKNVDLEADVVVLPFTEVCLVFRTVSLSHIYSIALLM